MNVKNVMLRASLDAWNTDLFAQTLINEIMSFETGVLPLQQGLTQGDMASEQPTKVTVLTHHENDADIEVKLAVFFTEIISGCSCGDDPAMINAYCEMRLTINKQTAQGIFSVTG